jgi:hypothetical protein
MLGISWFWFLGSANVTQLPAFVRQMLHGEPGVVTLLLGAFSMGVATGSLVSGRISGKRPETGLIPLAGLGMSLFGWDLSALSSPVGDAGVFGLLGSMAGWRVLLNFALIGMCGGIYIVPLLTFIQMRSSGRIRSRVIAANNILNAGFMVVSAILSAVLLSGVGISLPGYFSLLAAANLGVCIYIFRKVPRSVLRLGLRGLIRMVYRQRCQSLERLPESGPALLVCNHVSYIDALIISAVSRRIPPSDSIRHAPALLPAAGAALVFQADTHDSHRLGKKQSRFAAQRPETDRHSLEKLRVGMPFSGGAFNQGQRHQPLSSRSGKNRAASPSTGDSLGASRFVGQLFQPQGRSGLFTLAKTILLLHRVVCRPPTAF